MQHSEVRCALKIIGVEQGRILDVFFPAKGVIGLLIHRSYQQALEEKLSVGKIAVKTDFDPIAPANLMDRKYESLTLEERAIEARRIYQDRIFRACLQMPRTHLGFAIMRYLSTDLDATDHHRLDASYLEQFQKERPNPRSNSTSPPSQTSGAVAQLFSSQSGRSMDTAE
ncbi:hypothetical protein BJV82DRAFT_676705 [Fennellomyces sp. T-0311]|nr:hypothetical protein BJV82DRAFT_676705 [Fennellomyces sp. T-0311]